MTAKQQQLSELLDQLKPRVLQNTTEFPLRDRSSASEWVNGLPQRNTAATAVELYKALPKIIGLDVEPAIKKEIWDILYPVSLRCTQALMHSHLTPSSAKAISLGQAILKQTYEGWKLLAYQFQKPGGDLESVALCLQRACYSLSQIQINSLSLYLQQPAYLWEDLHKIYRIAELLEIENKVIEDDITARNSIKNLYIKLNMLACTRPNKFSSFELKYIFSELDYWVSLISINRSAKGALFAIENESIGAPRYADEASSNDETLYLHTGELVEHLNKMLSDQTEDKAFTSRAAQRIIKQLILQWGTKITRKETHLKDKAKVTIAPGIKGTMCALAKTDSFEKFLHLCGEVNKDATAVKNASESAQKHDAWESAFDIDRHQDKHLDAPIIYSKEEEKKPKPITLLRGVRNNTSINGSCIELIRENGHLVTPGELAAVNSRGSNEWQVGIIRWKHVTPSLNVTCGMQFPGKNAIPVAVRAFSRGKQTDIRYFPAILFTKGLEEKNEATLICQPLTFKVGSKLQVLSLRAKYLITLEEELESTEDLAHFRVIRC